MSDRSDVCIGEESPNTPPKPFGAKSSNFNKIAVPMDIGIEVRTVTLCLQSALPKPARVKEGDAGIMQVCPSTLKLRRTNWRKPV